MTPSESWHDHAVRQGKNVWAAGAPGVHFYVLNRSYSVSKILDQLSIQGHIPD